MNKFFDLLREYGEVSDINQNAAAIEHMIVPLSTDRQKRVVECIAQIVGAWGE